MVQINDPNFSELPKGKQRALLIKLDFVDSIDKVTVTSQVKQGVLRDLTTFRADVEYTLNSKRYRTNLSLKLSGKEVLRAKEEGTYQ